MLASAGDLRNVASIMAVLAAILAVFRRRAIASRVRASILISVVSHFRHLPSSRAKDNPGEDSRHRNFQQGMNQQPHVITLDALRLN
jgi:hypothetical protein